MASSSTGLDPLRAHRQPNRTASPVKRPANDHQQAYPALGCVRRLDKRAKKVPHFTYTSRKSKNYPVLAMSVVVVAQLASISPSLLCAAQSSRPRTVIDMEFTFLQDRLNVALISLFFGAILTLLTQRILNKRGLFTFYVYHYRVGVSADDAIFGSVRATWNNLAVDYLYSSSVELRNESLKDYENVKVKVYTNDTVLLTERTEIVGTSRIVEWTTSFAERVSVPPGGEPTEDQFGLYAREREYLIPAMNRGQKVRFTYLNTTSEPEQPTIWLDILHKGVKTKFRVAQTEFLGVPQSSAGWVGSVLGIAIVALVVATVETFWLVAALSFLLGLIALLPGAASIKLWRRFRDLVGG